MSWSHDKNHRGPSGHSTSSSWADVFGAPMSNKDPCECPRCSWTESITMHSLRPTLQNSMDVPLTTKHRITIWSSNSMSGSNGKESACNAGHLGLIPGSGRYPGEDHGNPLQYSCQENPMDRRAWQATGYRVAKSQTQWKQLTTASNSMSGYIP